MNTLVLLLDDSSPRG